MAAPIKKRSVSQTDRNRFAAFKRVAHDPLPHEPKVLRAIVKALLGRIAHTDPRAGRWCRWVIQGLAAREISADSGDHNYMRLACWNIEMMELEGRPDLKWKAKAPGHIPAVLRLQRDYLAAYFNRNHCPRTRTGLAEWLRQHLKRLHEELSFWPCLCKYESSFHDLNVDPDDGPGTLLIGILTTLHRISNDHTTKNLLKASYRSTQPPTFLR